MQASRRLARAPNIINPLRCSYTQSLLSYQAPRVIVASNPAFARSSNIFSAVRTMSSAKTTNEWLVILPDKPNAVQRRLEVRSKHLEAATERAAQGIINFGGIMLHDHIKEGETPKFKGSVMLLQVETEQEVWDIIKSDKYVENDVWDLEKVEVLPFRSALRKAL